MQPSFQQFDHTADVGVRVRAASLPELVVPAVNGLYAVIGELTAAGPALIREFDLTGPEPATILRDLLAELHYAVEHEGILAVDIAVSRFDDGRLIAAAQMRHVDERRSHYHREVKAVTYHELEIRPIEGGFEGVYIVDI